MKEVSIFIFFIGLYAILRTMSGVLLSIFHQSFSMKKGSSMRNYQPLITVIIPAYNEEKAIQKSVSSVMNQTYQNFQLVVIDDGSKDKTWELLKSLKDEYKSSRFLIVKQKNSGKSHAINNALKNYAAGELVMILDADSILEKNAVKNMVKHFSNKRVIAMSSNVRISKSNKLIELSQKIEYFLGYRLKGAEQLLRLEYIIGGVGSTFRFWALKEVGFYDDDVATEDIDMTLKLLLHFGNIKWIFGYALDSIAYTPPVHTFSQLIRQRYRWKLGRFQVLFKYYHLFLNLNLKKYTLTLSWWKLPKVFIEELFVLIDPIVFIFVLYVLIAKQNLSPVYGILVAYFVFSLITFLAEHMKTKQKLELLILSPLTYLFLCPISLVDFICLIRCLSNPKKMFHRGSSQSKWEHVNR